MTKKTKRSSSKIKTYVMQKGRKFRPFFVANPDNSRYLPNGINLQNGYPL